MLLYDTKRSLQNNKFASEIKEGLEANMKFVRPKFFYDQNGSKLFEEISEQPEYYLTSAELSILKKYDEDIYDLCGHHDISIVELGSGSSSKTRVLLDKFLSQGRKVYYFPIDVSESILSGSISSLGTQYGNLKIIGVCSEFSDGMKRVNEFIISHDEVPEKKLIMFLGSSIGNFEPSQVGKFLTELSNHMKAQDTLLIGFDLQKEKIKLERAYNDEAGITAKFNLNILSRINKELGGEFETSHFRHEAFYNSSKNRIEMYLLSMCNQSVAIKQLGKEFAFRRGERIHTENSYKFSLNQINSLATQCSLLVLRNYIDDNNLYCLSQLGSVSDTSKTGE